VLGAVLVTAPGYAAPINTDVKVSLNFDNTPIRSVLKMLAAQNDINMVVSSIVEGEVSITLDNVSLRAALDAVLLPNGYNYHIANDIIIVKDSEQQMAGELVPRIYRLKYLDAAIAEGALIPLLSDKGKISILGVSSEVPSSDIASHKSELVVFDYPEIHETVEALLPQIDLKKRQISVEVKIIETNLTKDEKLGINWPKSVAASFDGASVPTSTGQVLGEQGNELGVMPLEDGNWQLGYLSVHQVDLVIDFLEKRNNSKLLSNPRLTTMEGETATIQVQTVIPIQTINRFSEGAVIQDIVTFQDEEVGISLRVTPFINDDSAITMKVNPVVEEIIGYTGSTDNQKPITTERSVNTIVSVGNNETIALGGLLKETRIEAEEKVFLLGSIPILGALFTSRVTETQTTDLLILITPRIMN
jgi:type IV pilus assembly protein PilQ